MTATNPAQGDLVTRPQTAVAAKPIDQVRALLDKMLPQIKLALPKHLDANRMLRIVLTTVQRTPKLLECTRDSLLGCIVTCAQLGLEPDGMLGHAYLIPFWNGRKNANECQLIVGYKGLLKLARQSGEIASVSARVVYEKDDFTYRYGLVDKLSHVPSDEEDPGPVKAAYAVWHFKDGGHHFEVMTARQINRIRDASQGYKRDKEKSPWTTHYDEMAKKTVIRRSSKMVPASIEDKMARISQLEHQADQGLPQTLDNDVALFEPLK
jgi:recombination protein RecT